MKKILVVEDEQSIREGIENFLLNNGFFVTAVADGVAGVIAAQNESFDLILLDVMLPKMDGFAVLEVLRERSVIPVIMLTALGSTDQQIKGFELKADDYIVKPFDYQLLLKRIEAVLRRNSVSTPSTISTLDTLQHDRLRLDLVSCMAFLDENEIHLTKTEFDLLRLLMENPNKVFTRDDLLNLCWGVDYFGNEQLVNVHVGNLRKKIGECYIETVRGRGYKLVCPSE